MKIIRIIYSLCIVVMVSSCNAYHLLIDEGEEKTEEEDFINAKAISLVPFQKLEYWQNMQGGAIYADKLVCLMATDEMEGENENGFVYDIKTGKQLSSLLFSSRIGDRVFYKPHANQVSFGKSFFNEDSDFPLLYVSQVNGGIGTNDLRGELGVFVYDLRKKGEVGMYDPVLVQVIIPDLEDKKLMSVLGNYTPNYIYDDENNQFVVLGYPFSSWFDWQAPQPVAIMRVPDISEGGIVTLTSNDILDYYTYPECLSVQQSLVHNGFIFSLGGLAKGGILRVISVREKCVLKVFSLTDSTWGEPQFLGFWRNRLLYYEAGESGILYEIICS